MYKVILSRQAVKDAERLARAGLSAKAKSLTRIVMNNPFQTPPPYEKLVGDLRGYYSRRINEQHRYIYQILPGAENEMDTAGVPYEGIVKVLRMWTHYQ